LCGGANKEKESLFLELVEWTITKWRTWGNGTPKFDITSFFSTKHWKIMPPLVTVSYQTPNSSIQYHSKW